MLPPDQREGKQKLRYLHLVCKCPLYTLYHCAAIKEYIVGLVIKMSASDETLTTERAFVSKLNQILVEVCVKALVC